MIPSRRLTQVGLMSVLACSGTDTGVGADVAHDAAPGGDDPTVTYELLWDTSGVELALAPVALRFRSDLGITWTLSRVAVGTYAAELVPCADDVTRAASAPEGLALAGHSADPNALTVYLDTVETLPASGALLPEVPLETSPIASKAGRYCEVYVAARRIRPGWTGFDAALDGLSVVLEGTWQRDGLEPVAFRGDAIAAAALVTPVRDPDGASFTFYGGIQSGRVTITRHLASMMDGLDPTAEDEADVAYGALVNLLTSATAVVDVAVDVAVATP